jgi:methionine-rich copper-binding protein CopC
MSIVRISLGAAALAVSMFLATSAQAHPKLVSSTPAANAEIAAPAQIELKFSEALVAQFSGAKLLMTGMPGMTHAPMPVNASVSTGADPQTMVITPGKPLTTGTYRVDWRAVSGDTHPMTGSVTFSVK